MAPSKPQVVYANDRVRRRARCSAPTMAARTWTQLDASQFMVWRPFYFGNLIVDPKDENKIFKADRTAAAQRRTAARVSASSPAARTATSTTSGSIPTIRISSIAGDDGGLWRSDDGGTRWRTSMNLPVSQFYHVSVDNGRSVPRLRRLAGQQLLGRRLVVPGGVTNSRWENMFGGDGFWMFEDPSDPDYIYAEAQGGEIGRVNRYTHEIRVIKPYAASTARRSCASTGTRRST